MASRPGGLRVEVRREEPLGPTDEPNVVEHLLLDVRVEEDEVTRRARLRIGVATQWIFAPLFAILTTLIAVLFPPWAPQARSQDVFQTSWSLVWSALMLIHIILLLSMSHVRLRGRQPPRFLFHAQRFIRSLNTVWFFCGIKPLFWDKPYNTSAINLARALWWIQAGFFLIPLFLYLLICLCLPCILAVLSQVRTPSPNELPTPEGVLSKLEVKKYDDLLELLRREFGVHEVELRTSASRLHEALNRNPIVEVLTTGAIPSGRPDTTATDGTARPDQSLLGVQRLKIEKSCPICMVDFEKNDEVIVMPCDRRHFFHAECVKVWLRTSQFCPICRANIVTLIEPPGETSPAAADVEMQAS